MKFAKYTTSIPGTNVTSQTNSPKLILTKSGSRRSFLRASGAASVATVLAMNGLTIDVRADGNSSGSTFSPDYEITFSSDTWITALPGALDLESAQHYAEEYGASGADSGSSDYDPETQEIESTETVSGSWSSSPVEQDGAYFVACGTTLKFSGVRKAVAK